MRWRLIRTATSGGRNSRDHCVWWKDLRGSFNILAYPPMLCRRGLEKSTHRSILVIMAGKWLEIAQKMAQAARAGLAIERKRLNEILAERQQKQLPPSSQSSR